MREEDYKIAKQKLDKFHESNGRRRTPERYEVLRILYKFNSRITFEDIEAAISKKSSFCISRGTIYNALKLFIELGLIRCTRINRRSYYDVEYHHNTCMQVCRVCGKTKALPSTEAERIFEIFHPKRFDIESYTLRFDGICTSCKAKKTKEEKKRQKMTKTQQTDNKTRTKTTK